MSWSACCKGGSPYENSEVGLLDEIEAQVDCDHSSILYLNGLIICLRGDELALRVENTDVRKSLGVSVLESAAVTASDRVTHESGTFSGDAGGTSLLGCETPWVDWSLAIANVSVNFFLYIGQIRA